MIQNGVGVWFVRGVAVRIDHSFQQDVRQHSSEHVMGAGSVCERDRPHIFLATSLLGMDAPPSAYHCRQRTHCNSYAIRICDTISNWTSTRCKRQCCPCGRRLHPRSSRSHSKASCMACCRLCSMAGTSCSTPMRSCRCICIKSLAEPVTSTEPWTKPHLEIC